MAKHKYISSPQLLWEWFCQYRDETKAKPLKRVVKGNKGFIVSDEDLPRPLTLEGFEIWCFEKNKINDLGDYFSNKNNSYSEYSTICALIRKVIRQDQIEGGMAGVYNASITQRLNGLIDKNENAVVVSVADPDTLKAIAARMNEKQ